MPRTGRPRQFEEAAVLDAAMQLFWRQGYEVTSLDQLKQAMGLSSASFYGAFGSKEELYRKALAHYLATHGQVVASLYDDACAPREALRSALVNSARLQTDATLPQGCMLVLSMANASPASRHLQDFTADERRNTREAIKRCIQRAVHQGELRAETDVEGLSTLVDALLVGMSTQARDGVPPSSLDAAISALLSGWDFNQTERSAVTVNGS